MTSVLPGSYQHYRGNKYLVLAVVKHSETLEEMVLYVALYENEVSQIWVRPLSSFVEKVVINGKKVPRFKKLDPS